VCVHPLSTFTYTAYIIVLPAVAVVHCFIKMKSSSYALFAFFLNVLLKLVVTVAAVAEAEPFVPAAAAADFRIHSHQSPA